MAKILILYCSRTGNTEKMAGMIAEGVKAEGLEAMLKNVETATVDDLVGADGIVIGSPVYYGDMAAHVKKLIDDSVTSHGELEGKVGAAYAASWNVAGGNETTILSILKAMLIHGMIIQGDPEGDHFGPVSIGAPDERAIGQCKRMGQRLATLVKKLENS
ncbi:flavodoxin family protein [candidate division KSB1 bacterium]